ncbi:MAG: hypothetical protein AABX17_03215 [Nanoarchaeota archaeon]
MGEGSKVGSFWAGVVLTLPLFLIINMVSIILTELMGPRADISLVNSQIFSAMITSAIFILAILIGSIFLVIKYHRWRYFFLGVFSFIGAGIIFLGTCMTGAMLSSIGSTDGWAGLGGLMASTPFAIGFAIWFLTFIGIKVSKFSGESTKSEEHQEVLG